MLWFSYAHICNRVQIALLPETVDIHFNNSKNLSKIISGKWPESLIILIKQH